MTSISSALNGFLAAFNTSDTSLEWLRRAPCSEQLLSNEVAIDPQGELSIAGTFLETAFFDDNDLVSNGINDIFLSRFDPLSTSISEREYFQEDILISPNPATESLKLITTLTDFTIKIYDLRGRKVFEINNEKMINLTTFPLGNYWLRIENATFVKTIPFVKF